MLEDSDRAINGVKDNELELCILWNSHLGTKWATQQIKVLVHDGILVLQGKVTEENFHRMTGDDVYVMHSRVAIVLLNICHWKVDVAPAAKRQSARHEGDSEGTTTVPSTNCFQVFESHVLRCLGHGGKGG